LAAAETLYSKLVTYVCPRSAVGKASQATWKAKNLFRLWVADIRAPQSREQDIRNAYVQQTK